MRLKGPISVIGGLICIRYIFWPLHVIGLDTYHFTELHINNYTCTRIRYISSHLTSYKTYFQFQTYFLAKWTYDTIYVEDNITNIYAKKNKLYPPLMASQKIFGKKKKKKSENLAFQLQWQPIKIRCNWEKFIWLVEDYSRNISVNFCQNICSNTEINSKCPLSSL